MNAALEIRQLTKPYTRGGFLTKRTQNPVLKGINLTLPKGRVLGLVGESGCGKSTLCNVILGITPATSGTVQINGQDTARLNARGWRSVRRRMQVVFQDPYASLDPRFTVRRLISEPLDIHGLYKEKSAREKVLRELLASVQLDPAFLDRYPHEFSGGQRQRIAIARALALNPAILIADEPVSALDVSVQAQILNLLKQIQRARGLSMLFVTHDFAVARFLCDEIAVLQAGQIVEHAPARQLFEHPKHPYTKKLLAAVPRAEVCL